MFRHMISQKPRPTAVPQNPDRLSLNQVRIIRPREDGTREELGQSPVTHSSNHVTLCFQLIDDLLSSGYEPQELDGTIAERYVDGVLDGTIPIRGQEVQLLVERRNRTLLT